jgi:hypothetical protein
MKIILCVILVLALTACATCKPTDSPEVCRTKERNAGQSRQ